MALVITGLVMIFGDAVAVKVFDDVIRPRLYAKALVNTIMISGLLCFVAGLIILLTN